MAIASIPSITFTRPANTTAYTAGDVVGSATSAIHELTGAASSSSFVFVQSQRPDARNRVAPVQLSDGRWMLCADVLREALTGGLYAEGFALLPPELFSVVDVIPMADAVALLPIAEEPLAP